MELITATIAKETVVKAVEKLVDKTAEKALQQTVDKAEDTIRSRADEPVVSICEKLSGDINVGKLSDAALETRVEAAAHSACKFFQIPDAELIQGDSIGVFRNCDIFINKDVFQFSLEQFKDMKCLSFEDMTKVWSHECGHRILRLDFQAPWTQELGADFFTGVRSEMLGLPNSEFEKMLASTKGSISHPDGGIRYQAITYGRETVRSLYNQGITPTIENCKEAFSKSPFAQISYENYPKQQFSAFVDDRECYYKKAEKAKDNVNYYTVEAKKAVDAVDLHKAGDMQSKADLYVKKAEDANSNVERCTKLVNDESLTPGEKIRLKTETGWSDKLINSIRSLEEANVYKNAELVEVNGNLKRVDIDWNAKIPQDRIERMRSFFGDDVADKWSGKTNMDLIREGKAPYGPDGKQVNLHHVGQKSDSPLAELTDTEHKGNDSILHNKTKASEIERTVFRDERKAYWQSRYNELNLE